MRSLVAFVVGIAATWLVWFLFARSAVSIDRKELPESPELRAAIDRIEDKLGLLMEEVTAIRRITMMTPVSSSAPPGSDSTSSTPEREGAEPLLEPDSTGHEPNSEEQRNALIALLADGREEAERTLFGESPPTVLKQYGKPELAESNGFSTTWKYDLGEGQWIWLVFVDGMLQNVLLRYSDRWGR